MNNLIKYTYPEGFRSYSDCPCLIRIHDVHTVSEQYLKNEESYFSEKGFSILTLSDQITATVLSDMICQMPAASNLFLIGSGQYSDTICDFLTNIKEFASQLCAAALISPAAEPLFFQNCAMPEYAPFINTPLLLICQPEDKKEEISYVREFYQILMSRNIPSGLRIPSDTSDLFSETIKSAYISQINNWFQKFANKKPQLSLGERKNPITF